MGDEHWAPMDAAAFGIAAIVVVGLVLAGAFTAEARQAGQARGAVGHVDRATK